MCHIVLKHKYKEIRKAPTSNMTFTVNLTRTVLMRCPNIVGEEINSSYSANKRQKVRILFSSI